MGWLRWILISLLAIFALRRCVLVFSSLLPGRRCFSSSYNPSVSIVVAARNQGSEVKELLQALDRLDYPSQQLFIVVVDDASQDATSEILARWAVERARVRYLALTEPAGKSAALNSGLAVAPPSELVAVYDADQRPHATSLRILASAFQDPEVGAASGYRKPSNAEHSLVSRYAALEAWVHQLVNQAGKDRLDWNPPTMGGNCVYRRSALARIGGFPPGSISEDTEVSLALVADGWRTRFLADAQADSLVSESLRHYWRQRMRWTRGNYGATKHASSKIESWLVVLGYADRLVILAILMMVAFGKMAFFWPALYLVVPLTASFAAILQAGVGMHFPMHLFSILLMFPVDIAVTVVASLKSVFRRPLNRAGTA